MSYSFNISLKPYGDNPNAGVVCIDTGARYGCWEYRDGTEGGGLWFTANGDALELTDYDGAFELPRAVVTALRNAGFILDQYFDN